MSQPIETVPLPIDPSGPMRITLDRDEFGIIRVYCTVCMRTVGMDLVPVGVLYQPFEILLDHVGEGHDGP